MFLYDEKGALIGLAYGDGDGNWNNELSSLFNGLACAGTMYATFATGGVAALALGTAGTCGLFGMALYDVMEEYRFGLPEVTIDPNKLYYYIDESGAAVYDDQ